MFCPQCGSTQGDELKFCKQCGANLHALRRVMASRDESDEKFNWNNTWLAEMFMSEKDAVKHQAELERLQGVTPESKRLAEIKGGVISTSVGVGLMIFLYVFMQGLIASGAVSDIAAVILSRVWIAGIIPVFVGLALIFNGMVVSRKSLEQAKHQTDTDPELPESSGAEPYHSPAETNQLTSGTPFSIIDETTKNLVKEVKR